MSEIERKIRPLAMQEFNRRMFSTRTKGAMLAVIAGAQEVLALNGHTQAELQTEFKVGVAMTPRTLADLRSSAAIYNRIREEFPDDAINDEEAGEFSNGRYTWHVDPLDGTSSYARGQRYSTVGIAIYDGRSPYAAAIYQPFENELVVAEFGKGALLLRPGGIDGGFTKEVHVSTQSLNGGVMYVDALFNDQTSSPKLAFMREVVELGGNNVGFRMTGSNIDQQRQVATGRAEASITDAVGGFYDLAAGGLIITESGGLFTDIYGNPVDLDTQIAIGSNGVQHQELLEKAQKCYQGYKGFK